MNTTPRDAAEQEYPKCCGDIMQSEINEPCRDAFVKGAEWQAREQSAQPSSAIVEDAVKAIRGALKIAIADEQASELTRTWCEEALKRLPALSSPTNGGA